jgi:peptide/nickel transport system substrate-binding protein
MKILKGAIVSELVIILMAGVILFTPFALWAQPQKGVMKGTWHFSISADWLDPSVTNPSSITCFFPLYIFHDALIKPMPDAVYSPSLAESWTISSDYRTFKFKLRKGVKFHNGDEMTAEDVVFTFNRYKAGPAAMLRSRIEKLEAENPYLFSVTFKKPFPDFLEYLLPGATAIAWIVPKKYIEKVGDAEYKKHPVGAGPYKFVEFKPGVVFVGEAFENYWRKVPKVKRLEIYGVTERPTRYAMVKRGEVDWASSMTDVFYKRVKEDPNLRMETGLSPTAHYIYMAAQWDPKSPWSDPRVRKAASLALDRKPLTDVVYPEAPPIDSIGMPGDPEALHSPLEPYNPEKAKKLLAEAGYPNGFKGGKFNTFIEHSAMGEMVTTYWKAIGIDVELTPLQRVTWFSLHHSGKMKGETFIDMVAAPTINARLNYIFGPKNYGNYPDIQALWDQYNQAIDQKIRKERIMQIQKMMYDRTMVIPLMRAAVPTAVGPRVKGTLFKFRKGFPLWYPTPVEDLELNE